MCPLNIVPAQVYLPKWDAPDLIIDCPTRNDAQVLLQQFANDLYLIATRLKIVETIDLRVTTWRQKMRAASF